LDVIKHTFKNTTQFERQMHSKEWDTSTVPWN
jgi:hypothetical protein